MVTGRVTVLDKATGRVIDTSAEVTWSTVLDGTAKKRSGSLFLPLSLDGDLTLVTRKGRKLTVTTHEMGTSQDGRQFITFQSTGGIETE